MAAGSIAGGIKSAAIDGELNISSAIEHIKISFKEAYSADMPVRNGTVTMDEFSPGGDLISSSISSAPVYVIPGGLSLKTGCLNCKVKPGSGSIISGTSGRLRDGASSQASRVLVVEMVLIAAPVAAYHGVVALGSNAPLFIHEGISYLNKLTKVKGLADLMDGMSDAALPRVNPNDHINPSPPPAIYQPK